MLPLLFLFVVQTAAREDATTLLERVSEAQEHQQTAMREYTFREQTVTEHLDGDGNVSKTEGETYIVTPSSDGEYKRLVAKDGHPLSAKESAEEAKKLEKHVAEDLSLPAEERDRKTREKLKRRIERYQERLEEAMEVYRFEPLPDIVVDEQPLRVFRFAAKPDYEPHSRATKVFARMEGTVWIDPARNQLARLAIEFTEDLTFLGGVFGRVSKGTRATIDAELRDDLWMLEHADVWLNARLYFLKRYRRHIVIDYDGYRKYEVDSQEVLRTTLEH